MNAVETGNLEWTEWGIGGISDCRRLAVCADGEWAEDILDPSRLEGEGEGEEEVEEQDSWRFHLFRRFWNQILICVSVSLKDSASPDLSELER